MPAVSVAQRKMMAIAKHHPEKLYTRNKAVLSMAKGELHKFAATKEKGLVARKATVKHYRKKAGK